MTTACSNDGKGKGTVLLLLMVGGKGGIVHSLWMIEHREVVGNRRVRQGW